MNQQSKFHYPFISPGDFSAFWALFTDNFTNLLVISGICGVVFKMPNEIVFGRIVPGATLFLAVGVFFYSWLAHRLAQQEQRDDVTALPFGISTPVMFVYLFGVIGPIYWTTGNALAAWQVGLGAGFVGGIVAALGCLIGPFIQRVTPRAGMLGTLCGIALVFIGTVALATVFESPIIGFVSLMFVFWGLVGQLKLPFNIPAGLVALLVATCIALMMGQSSVSLDGVDFYLPMPYIGDMITGLQYLFKSPELLLLLIPVQIYNFIETMNNVESASAAGDKYPVGSAMLFDGVATSLSAVMGNPFPTTVYIGHPGYKRIEARAGYTAMVGVVLLLASTFGLLAFLSNLIPLAATAPVLVYIAITLISESAAACPRRHGMAIGMAMMPHVSSLMMVKWNALKDALDENGVTGLPDDLLDPKLIDAMNSQGAHVVGHSVLANGSIITGMIWGAFTALIIDHKLTRAGYFTLTAALMSSVGIIHGSQLHWPQLSGITTGYFLMSAFLIIYPRIVSVELTLPDERRIEPALEDEATFPADTRN